jgi:beta-glucosidase
MASSRNRTPEKDKSDLIKYVCIFPNGEKMKVKLFYKSLPLALACAGLITGCSHIGGKSTSAQVPNTEDIAASRASYLVGQMTLDEKIQMVHGRRGGGMGVGFIQGIPRLKIPNYSTIDASVGVNAVAPAMIGKAVTLPVTLPSTLALAATWSPHLSYEYGDLVGREARALGLAEALGGGVNLTRDPRNGRTFEYMGEDPLLAGLMIVERIKGTQDNKVVSTIKHYAANDQETNRINANSVVDERTLREIHLLPFEIAAKSGELVNLMCAYNFVNGEKSCQNKYLLTDLLKGEWGYKGKVQSDWNDAVTDTVAAALGGLDEEQEGSTNDFKNKSFFNQKLKAAVESGKVPMGRLDDMVKRRLYAMIKVGMFDSPPPATRQNVDAAHGDAVALKVAESATVLLKNQPAAGDARPVLPLDPSMTGRIVVIGGNANAGVLSGGGSGGSYPRGGNAVTDCVGRKVEIQIPVYNLNYCAYWNKSAPLAAIAAQAPKASVKFYDGKDISVAVEAAKTADVVIVFATQYQAEGWDLPSLNLPDNKADPQNQRYDQDALIGAVAGKAKKTVVVLETGSAVVMPWIDTVHSVLEAWYPGSRGGDAIANILFGRVNPSGKLPMTFPKREADLPATIVSTKDSNGLTQIPYSEGRKIGYRWFDDKNIEPLFPFGHGLSYTTFDYSDISTQIDPGGEVTISFVLKNTGNLDGKEIAQIYAQLPAEAGDMPQRLVAWQVADLKAGESRRIRMQVPRQRLAIWDVQLKKWRVSRGDYVFKIGTSSRDSRALKVKSSLSGATLHDTLAVR